MIWRAEISKNLEMNLCDGTVKLYVRISYIIYQKITTGSGQLNVICCRLSAREPLILL